MVGLFIFAATLDYIYWRLHKTNMDVPDNAEQFDPDADDWRDTMRFTPIIYIKKG